MAVWVPVVAAVVSAIVGPMLLIWRQHKHELLVLREDNTQQHAEGKQLLTTIHQDLRTVHQDLGKIDGRTEAVVEAVESIREWVHTHEVKHAVEELRRQGSDGGTNRPRG